MGPWQVIAKDMFPDLIPQVGTWSPVKVNLTIEPVIPPVKGRFVKYECATMYGDACALHYVGVVQRRNMQQVTPDPQGMFDVGSFKMILDRKWQQQHCCITSPFSIPFSFFPLIVS